MPTRTLLPVKATADEESLLSSFSDLRAGWEVDEYIEPLTGIARHPLFKMPGCPWRNGSIQRHGKFDIGYLILTNHCDEQGHPRQRCSSGRPARARNLFFDLGCSTYSGNVSLETGSGIGPSIPLFIQLYERRCIEFDMIYAWEATPHAGDTWWDTVPLAVRPKLHFYNHPVSEHLVGADGSYTHPHSFLAMLNRTAEPADFVVLKVDIEGQV